MGLYLNVEEVLQVRLMHSKVKNKGQKGKLAKKNSETGVKMQIELNFEEY